MRTATVLRLTCLALTVAGCSTTRPAATVMPDRFPNHSESEILESLRSALPDSLVALRAEAAISIVSPVYSGTATARIEHRRGDSLFVSLSGTALRIEAGRLLLTRDSLFYYDRLQNRLYFGPRSALADRLPTILLEAPIFDRLLGLVTPQHGELAMRADSTYYHLESSLLRYTIDPTIWRTANYRHAAADGALVEALGFTEFDATGGVPYPRRIGLRRPGERTNISLHYREMTLNPPVLSLRLSTPAGVDRINIEDLGAAQ